MKNKTNFLVLPFIVGGAYMNKKFATSYGADACFEIVLTVIESTEAIINKVGKLK